MGLSKAEKKAEAAKKLAEALAAPVIGFDPAAPNADQTVTSAVDQASNNILDQFINSDNTNDEEQDKELKKEENEKIENDPSLLPEEKSAKLILNNVPKKYWKFQTV